MNFSDKTWNIINSIGVFCILGGAALVYEQRIGLPGGLRNVYELTVWIFVLAMMLSLVAIISWFAYSYSSKSTDPKLANMRFTYWMLIWSVILMAAVKFLPDGIF